MTKDELIQAIRMSPNGRVRVERGRPGGLTGGWARLTREGSDWAVVDWDNGNPSFVPQDGTLKVVEPFPPGLERLVVEESVMVTVRRYLRWPSESDEDLKEAAVYPPRRPPVSPKPPRTGSP